MTDSLNVALDDFRAKVLAANVAAAQAKADATMAAASATAATLATADEESARAGLVAAIEAYGTQPPATTSS